MRAIASCRSRSVRFLQKTEVGKTRRPWSAELWTLSGADQSGERDARMRPVGMSTVAGYWADEAELTAPRTPRRSPRRRCACGVLMWSSTSGVNRAHRAFEFRRHRGSRCAPRPEWICVWMHARVERVEVARQDHPRESPNDLAGDRTGSSRSAASRRPPAAASGGQKRFAERRTPGRHQTTELAGSGPAIDALRSTHREALERTVADHHRARRRRLPRRAGTRGRQLPSVPRCHLARCWAAPSSILRAIVAQASAYGPGDDWHAGKPLRSVHRQRIHVGAQADGVASCRRARCADDAGLAPDPAMHRDARPSPPGRAESRSEVRCSGTPVRVGHAGRGARSRSSQPRRMESINCMAASSVAWASGHRAPLRCVRPANPRVSHRVIPRRAGGRPSTVPPVARANARSAGLRFAAGQTSLAMRQYRAAAQCVLEITGSCWASRSRARLRGALRRAAAPARSRCWDVCAAARAARQPSMRGSVATAWCAERLRRVPARASRDRPALLPAGYGLRDVRTAGAADVAGDAAGIAQDPPALDQPGACPIAPCRQAGALARSAGFRATDADAPVNDVRAARRNHARATRSAAQRAPSDCAASGPAASPAHRAHLGALLPRDLHAAIGTCGDHRQLGRAGGASSSTTGPKLAPPSDEARVWIRRAPSPTLACQKRCSVGRRRHHRRVRRE